MIWRWRGIGDGDKHYYLVDDPYKDSHGQMHLRAVVAGPVLGDNAPNAGYNSQQRHPSQQGKRHRMSTLDSACEAT